jgi:hypothetical protein
MEAVDLSQMTVPGIGQLEVAGLEIRQSCVSAKARRFAVHAHSTTALVIVICTMRMRRYSF